MRKSFVLHLDSLLVLDKMSDEQSGKLFKAIHEYLKNGIVGDVDILTEIALTPFVNQFVRDDAKYGNVVERNKSNGLKGGRPTKEEKAKEPKEPSGLSGLYKKPKETQRNPKKPRKADSDSDSDSDSDRLTAPAIADGVSEEDLRIFGELQRWIEKHAPSVGKMKEPLTAKQYVQIKAKGFTKSGLTDLLLQMHNYEPLKKNKSTYLTLCNWQKRRDGGSKAIVRTETNGFVAPTLTAV